MREQVPDFFAGRELLVQRVVDVGGKPLHVDVCGVEAQLRGDGGHGRDAVVGSKRDPDVAESSLDVFVEPGEEAVEIGVNRINHGALFGRVGSDPVAQKVRGGNADGQEVGCGVLTQSCACDESLGEVELVAYGGGVGPTSPKKFFVLGILASCSAWAMRPLSSKVAAQSGSCCM